MPTSQPEARSLYQHRENPVQINLFLGKKHGSHGRKTPMEKKPAWKKVMAPTAKKAMTP